MDSASPKVAKGRIRLAELKIDHCRPPLRQKNISTFHSRGQHRASPSTPPTAAMFPSLLRTAAPRRLLQQPTPFLRPLTTAAAAAATQPQPPSATPHAPTTTSRPGPPDPRLPYFVSRTPFKKLAVYALNKRGGSLKLTMVKKIEGDKTAFKSALMKELQLEADQVRIKVPTGHIEVSVSLGTGIPRDMVGGD